MKKDIIQALLMAGRPDLADAMRSFRVGDDPADTDAEHAGLFIRLPKDIASQFPSLAPQDTSDPHITVLYVGNAAEAKCRAVQAIATPILQATKPFDVQLAPDVSYFPPSDHSDGKRVAKMEVVSPELHAVRNQLWRGLERAGLSFSDHYPVYQPHVTLGYIEPDESWQKDVPQGKWRVTAVELWGTDETPIPLGNR